MKRIIVSLALLASLFLSVPVRADYDPTVQRFIQIDPIGELGGINLYQFVGNNPVNHIDPLGLAYGDWNDPRTYFGNPPGVTVLPNGDLFMPGAVNPALTPTFGALHGIDTSWMGGSRPGDFLVDRAVDVGNDSLFAMSMLTPLGEEEGAAEAGGGLWKWLKSLPSKCKNWRKPSLQNLTRRELAELINARQKDLLRDLFGSGRQGAEQALKALQEDGSLPEGLTKDALLTYQKIAEKAIAEGIDTAGTQAARLKVIQQALSNFK